MSKRHASPPAAAPAAAANAQAAAGLSIQTFGCRLNFYESEVMRRHAEAAGLDDALIINTCAVTSEAQRQAEQAIRRAHRQAPDRPIIVTGCAAQIAPERFAGMPQVARVLGNEEKLTAQAWGASDSQARVQVNDIMQATSLAPQLIDGFDQQTRAFIQVQQGCDHRCTFCIIPFGRGNARSVPMGDVITQVRHLVEGGTKEVVLTGVDITSYGPDLPGAPSLGQLVRRLLAAVPELPRLRLSSIDSIEIDEHLLHVLANEPRFMPHLHLSLQAGSDLILKRMKRRHLRADALRVCQQIRDLRPDVVFGADLIAGFPTETEAQFQDSLALVEDCGLIYLHVFPYSERAGTPAARMPQVPKAQRKERAARLRAAGEAALAAYTQSQIGSRCTVLSEQGGVARSPQFLPLALPGVAAGQLVEVELAANPNTRPGAPTLRGLPLSSARLA